MTCLFFQDLTETERAEVWLEVQRNVSSGAWSELLFPWNGLALWPTARHPNLICLEAPLFPEAARWPLAAKLDLPPLAKADTAHFAEFRPHITLMRFRGVAVRRYGKEWAGIARDIPQIPPSAVRFDRVSLFLSDVKPERPVYTREYTARLQ
jgi:2'-5' RNA ligase